MSDLIWRSLEPVAHASEPTRSVDAEFGAIQNASAEEQLLAAAGIHADGQRDPEVDVVIKHELRAEPQTSDYPELADPAHDYSVELSQTVADGDIDLPRVLSRQQTENTENSGEDGGPLDRSNSARSRLKLSSKNEGQHTDRRYLCYMCNKLFTRRRSVRDHIAKIHNVKQWEPNRSLEIIVDPGTGEPVEDLQKQLYSIAAKPLLPARESSEQPETVLESREPVEQSPAPERPNSLVKAESPAVVARSSPAELPFTPAPVIGKKRPAPISGGSVTKKKKGIAKSKSAVKKPKLTNSESTSEAMFRSPSATPVSTQQKVPGSKLRRNISANSPTSAEPSPAPSIDDVLDDEEMEDEFEAPYSAADTPQTMNSDGEVYCICRKGDNHSWMIACDGGCDEWFHGRCVDIRERDGELIDKYICPKCQTKGVGQTTWKRMCRRKGCRKPARVLEKPPSKYCSTECGRRFFVELVQRGDEAANVSKTGQFVLDKPKPKKTRRKHRTQLDADDNTTGAISSAGDPGTPQSENDHSEYETDSSADDEDLPNRGGALRAGEVKAIANQCKTIEDWRALGKKPLTPPPTASRSTTDAESKIELNGDTVMSTEVNESAVPYDDFETTRLSALRSQVQTCETGLTSLNFREQLLNLIRDRSTKIAEEVRKSNPKLKDVCGYDPRLSWTMIEFLQWRNSDEGKAVLNGEEKLGAPSSPSSAGPVVHPNGIGSAETKQEQMHEDSSEDEEKATMPQKGGVCAKNRCARHGKWAKMQIAEIRFEQDLMKRKGEKLRREMDGIRSRAVLRKWETRGPGA